MPLYEYECDKCNRRTEKIEPVKGPHLKKCPHCGGKVERLLSSPAIQFKGTGWYVTDYAGKKSSGSEMATGKSDTKEGSGKEPGAAKESSAKELSTKESGSSESKEKKASKKKE